MVHFLRECGMTFSIASMFASLIMKNIVETFSLVTSVIYNLQESLYHFIIVILLGSEQASSSFITFEIPHDHKLIRIPCLFIFGFDKL